MTSMAVPTQGSVHNRLLATLSPADFSVLERQLEPVPLPVRTCLVEPNTPIEHVYFLEQGIASVVATTLQGRRIEAGMVGREGMSGISVLLGADRTPHECFVQTMGEGLQIRTDNLRRAMAARPSLHQHLLLFVQAFMIQIGQTALANGSYRIEERLARWLLMCHDRVDGNDLSTTHEFLSLMLGVRRAGVTDTLKVLEDRGLIATKRGQVTVLDRAKLETVAGDSYGVPEAEYVRLFSHPAAELPRIVERVHRIEDPSGRTPDGIGSGLAVEEPVPLHGLAAPWDLPSRLSALLDATIDAQRADFGNIQLYDDTTGTLAIVVHRGFSQEFLDHFATVDAHDTSACGQALKRSARTLIEDVTTDPSFEPHRAIAAAAGFRAVQSTPLLDRTGAPVGMLSTHFRRHPRPSDWDLSLTDRYAQQAADVIAFSLANQQHPWRQQVSRAAHENGCGGRS
jgi:CRP-like cAMP-binding protein